MGDEDIQIVTRNCGGSLAYLVRSQFQLEDLYASRLSEGVFSEDHQGVRDHSTVLRSNGDSQIHRWGAIYRTWRVRDLGTKTGRHQHGEPEEKRNGSNE